MKIYTKTGDGGETGLFGGPRVGKDHPRVEAIGTVDELNAALGQTRAADVPQAMDAVLAEIQADLFVVGAELATSDASQGRLLRIEADRTAALEAAIDRYQALLPPLKQFILPGGTRAAAALHAARGICRRAERRVVSLQHSGLAPDTHR
ncbi:MAG: cob(I)yrinic acid a,c-diamide adenosyltransferase, partial [Pirellulaceae bacterium]